ncbi:MAG: hypothetical protein ACOX0A_00605 [Thermoguttaceae bacterium]|jgi:hypothetical protein
MASCLHVGVTGRRHIVPSAVPAIERATQSILRTLNESDAECVVVSTGLAVGADSIVARVLLDLREREPNFRLRLRALLPMSLDDYEDDFNKNELRELHSILAQCDDVTALRPVRSKDGRLDRVAQYAALRDRLVEESEVLLAYWSGDASVVKKGSTVDVVLSKLREFMNGRSGAIISVATPELLRIRTPDGGKKYVPEKLDVPGRVSLSTFGSAERILPRFTLRW